MKYNLVLAFIDFRFYSYGLKIATISSKKLGDANEGVLDNKYQMQGEFAEMDDDIGWNDFALRNYDPQVGRWVQQDPYQEFASPYLGMANDPVNTIDPTGGIYIPLHTFVKVAAEASSGVSKVLAVSEQVASTMSTVMKIAIVATKVLQVANVLNTAFNTGHVGNGLFEIRMKGFSDAWWNAISGGLHDVLFGNSFDNYENIYEKEAYLEGRLAGDGTAMAAGAALSEAGISSGSRAAVIPGGQAVAIGSATAAVYGAAVSLAATYDAAWATAKLLEIQSSAGYWENHWQNKSSEHEPNWYKQQKAKATYPRDRVTKNTKNSSAWYKSEREARNLAREKLGKDPVEIEPGKWRSQDGKWQYRAKPNDIMNKHIHLEELNPKTGEVKQNIHLRWK